MVALLLRGRGGEGRKGEEKGVEGRGDAPPSRKFLDSPLHMDG